jgi:uncharacterized membrane protein YebE (DUF533 family)
VAFTDLRQTARAARKDGHFDADEKAAIKADLVELVTEVGELLGAGRDLVQEVAEAIKSKL